MKHSYSTMIENVEITFSFTAGYGVTHQEPGEGTQIDLYAVWLLDDNPWATANLVCEAQTLGVAGERLVFAPKLPLAQHLARYRAADLALDTFPYTSHTTASDALWGDCLLVALCGETVAARVSGSILNACDMPELVTYALADYKQLTLRMATDKPFRDAMRTKLQANKLATPLFDSRAFTRDLEQLYGDLAGRR